MFIFCLVFFCCLFLVFTSLRCPVVVFAFFLLCRNTSVVMLSILILLSLRCCGWVGFHFILLESCWIRGVFEVSVVLLFVCLRLSMCTGFTNL